MRARESSFGLLALLIGAVAILWLAAACGGEAYEEDPCGTRPSTEEGDMASETDEAARERRNAERARIKPVIERHEALIRRQPTIHGYGASRLREADGERTGRMGIVIVVEKKVDQSTLPPEDRIPGCLEGVPVQFVVEGPMYQE